ncbi:hypothetical protein ZWY2020_009848 [Hordeum vulgare]|nr:hypothetical protein ZWY2020_009848 [Hordeum vulgare]
MSPSASAAPTSSSSPAPFAHVAFSSGGSHFVASTATGFDVFSCDDSVEHVRYRCKSTAVVPDGVEVTSAELSTRSRVAFVARDTGAAEHCKIYLWKEESDRKIRLRVTTTPGALGAVGAVRLLGDDVLVAGQEKAALLVGGEIESAEPVATGTNPLGLCALAAGQAAATLVYALPRPEKGAVQVRRSGQSGSVDVQAHSSSLSCIALSRDGRLLATAGSKGTLVRIFSTNDGTMVQELRRGIDRADIHCIAFSPDSRWLAVSSDKGTVHVFPVVGVDKAIEGGGDDDKDTVAVAQPAAAPATVKQGSSLSFLKGYLPSYFRLERSHAQVRLREGVEYTVEFWRHHPNTILIAGTDGSFYRCRFDPVNAGEMKQLKHERFNKKLKKRGQLEEN